MKHYKYLTVFLISHSVLALPITTLEPGREKLNTIGVSKLKFVEELAVNKLEKNLTLVPHSNKDSNKFKLDNIRFIGNTIYKDSELLVLANNFVGKKVSIQDLSKITNLIKNHYRNNGYLLCQVLLPPQDIYNNTVTIKVNEGSLTSYNIVNHSKLKNLDIIKYYGEKITKAPVFNIKALESYILMINSVPGIKAKAIIGQDKTCNSKTCLNILIYQYNKYNYNIALDNKLNKNYGRYQIAARYNLNLPTSNSIISAGFKLPKKHKALKLYSIGLTKQFGLQDLKLTTQYSVSKTNINDIELDNISNASTHGSSRGLNIKLDKPIILTRAKKFNIYTKFDIVDNISSGININNTIIQNYEDFNRVLRIGGNVQFYDNLSSINSINLEYSQGLKILGADKTIKSRTGGRLDFKKINIEYERLQVLPKNFSINFKFKSQYSFHELLANEEYTIGRNNLSAGYDTARIVGDSGIGTKLELRKDYFYKAFDGQPFVFFDINKVFNKSSNKIIINNEMRKSISAASIGVGSRIAYKNLNLNVEIDKPLTLTDSCGKKHPRVIFKLEIC